MIDDTQVISINGTCSIDLQEFAQISINYEIYQQNQLPLPYFIKPLPYKIAEKFMSISLIFYNFQNI